MSQWVQMTTSVALASTGEQDRAPSDFRECRAWTSASPWYKFDSYVYIRRCDSLLRLPPRLIGGLDGIRRQEPDDLRVVLVWVIEGRRVSHRREEHQFRVL